MTSLFETVELRYNSQNCSWFHGQEFASLDSFCGRIVELIRFPLIIIFCTQAEERLPALDKVHLEAAQLEWLHEMILSNSLLQNQPLGLPRSMRADKQSIDIAWWDRKQVRKNLYAASTAIRQATEELQVSNHFLISVRQKSEHVL